MLSVAQAIQCHQNVFVDIKIKVFRYKIRNCAFIF